MTETTVLEVGGLQWATSVAVVESALLRRPGVTAVEASAVSQTATVTYDPAATSIVELSRWVRDCGYHCAGRSVPHHVCDPMEEAAAGQVAMRDMLGFSAGVPFGLRDDVFSLLLSLPVVFYSAWIFFDGAYRALRARTLDMMVLVAVAVAAGWLYSVGVTLTGGGAVFYEAAAMLTTFVLLGHWFEMRARGGANDAIRTLLDLAPPMAVVLRGGEVVEVPTAEVVVGDLVLIRPGGKIPVDGIAEDVCPRWTSPW